MSEVALRTNPARGKHTIAAQVQPLRERGRASLGPPDRRVLEVRRLPGDVEDFFASIQMPVGLAGPLLFAGDQARGLITAPLATTEGALVAAASRGARAITLCGGVTTRVLSPPMNRAPGCGMRVTAECFIDRPIVSSVLKSTSDVLDHARRCASPGVRQAGTVGYSDNAAHLMAAMFLATGQDVAGAHESGAGIFSMESTVDGVRAFMLLPSLVICTASGATPLPRQRDLLASMGCDCDAERLAEIIAGFALALDLSKAWATTGPRVTAHQRLGRAASTRWLREGDLNPGLIQPLLAESLQDKAIAVESVATTDNLPASGIFSRLSVSSQQRKLLGLRPLHIAYTNGNGRHAELDAVAKVKALDDELLLVTGKLAALCGSRVTRAWNRWGRHTELRDSHLRELALYRRAGCDPALRAAMPRCFGTLEDPGREVYVVLMERLNPPCLQVRWGRPEIEAALHGIARVHRRWLGREGDLLDARLLGHVPGPALLEVADELWAALADHNSAEHPGLIDGAALTCLRRLAAGSASWAREVRSLPRTLVHNSFNPRNLGLRDSRRLVAYDWELATLDVPQRDLAELLAFTLTPEAGTDEVAHYLEVHRRALDPGIDPQGWRRGYRLALHEFLLTRLQIYLMAHTHHEYAFMPGVVQTAWHLWELET